MERECEEWRGGVGSGGVVEGVERECEEWRGGVGSGGVV